MDATDERLRALEAAVRELQDKEQILRTLYQYSHALDRATQADDMVDCFTENGVWRSSVGSKTAGIAGALVEGRAAIAEWFMRGVLSRGPDPQEWRRGNCNITSPDIRIEGDRATSECYVIITHEDPAGPKIGNMGRYLDTLVRCPDGRWRFEERHYIREGTTPAMQKRPITNRTPEEEAAGIDIHTGLPAANHGDALEPRIS